MITKRWGDYLGGFYVEANIPQNWGDFWYNMVDALRFWKWVRFYRTRPEEQE